MLETSVTIVNRLGLHARAAAQLVRLASGFESMIKLTRPDTSHSADAKSILNVLTLAASKGTVLVLEVDGNDETAAFEAVQEMFRSGFGEV
jgi:phosphotransferase system HPr (HPr) family protein